MVGAEITSPSITCAETTVISGLLLQTQSTDINTLSLVTRLHYPLIVFGGFGDPRGLEIVAARRRVLGGAEGWESREGVLAMGGRVGRLGGGRSPP